MSDVVLEGVPEAMISTHPVIKPASWLATINFLECLALKNNIIPAILGEKGSGKTTFSQVLYAQLKLKANIKPYLINASMSFNRSFFLQQLKELLNIDVAPSLSNFIDYFTQQTSPVLIIIDDAQFLSLVFIEELLGELRQQGSTGFFQVCLITDYSLVPSLNKVAQHENNDAVHSIELGTLTESETKEYLLQVLMPRQYLEKRVTEERVKQFYQLTAGHIADINRQMESYFCMPAKASKIALIFRPVNIASAVLVLFMVYMWHAYQSQSVPKELLDLPRKYVEDVPLSLPSHIEPALLSSIPTYDVAAIRQSIIPTPIRRSDLVAINEEDNDALNSSDVVLDKVIVAPKKLVPESVTLPSMPTRALPTISKKASLHLKRKGRYTIQLLASHSKKVLQQFVSVHHLQGKTQFRRSFRNGSAWYVLTIGEFAERQQALNEANNLPSDIIKLKPWVRVISDLKDLG